MARVVRLTDLLLADAPTEAGCIGELPPFSADPSIWRHLWGTLLALAYVDRASSVHYHPWLKPSEGCLWYIVAGVRYELVPPPPEWASAAVGGARSLLRSGLLKWFVKRMVGSTQADAGQFRLDLGGCF